MKYCRKDFIDEMRKILSLRERRTIEYPPFSHAAVLVPLFQKGEDCYFLLTKRSDQVKYHKSRSSSLGEPLKKKIRDWRRLQSGRPLKRSGSMKVMFRSLEYRMTFWPILPNLP
jgi:hypothetical protein